MNPRTDELADDPADLCLLPFDEVDRPDLYYLHDISGSVVQFSSVARQLAHRRNVVGVQCAGLDADFPPDDSVEAMADRYLRAITAQHTGGPYEIVGYSMGALIALELAQRLLALGEPVGLLGFLDPPVPGTLGPMDVRRVVRMIARNLGVGPVAAAGTDDPGVLVDILLAEARSSGALPAGYQAEDLHEIIDLQLVNGRAAEVYRPAAAYPGPVRLLCAGTGELAARAAGWARFVRGPVLGEEIDADHVSVLRGGNATAVAAVLERWLPEP